MFLNSVKTIIKRLYSPKYLIITNSMTGIVSMSIGDSIQQFIESKLQNNSNENNEQKEFEFNKRRNLNMMSAGLYFGLFGHFWYSLLDKRFPGRQTRSVLKKLATEMAMGPPLVSGVFLIISKLKGMSFKNSCKDLKSNLFLICAVEWSLFIPLQYINFSVLLPQFRYLYVAVISLGYDAFLSYVIHRNDRRNQLKQLNNE